MFKTLDDLKNEGKQEKKDEKKKTNSYAGGEKRYTIQPCSGLAVEQPDQYKEILNQAKQQGAKPAADDDPREQVKITLWSNGFQINDGEFQEIDDPKSKQFLNELKQGYVISIFRRVPQSLRQQYPQGLSVALEDRSKEAFKKPPPPPYIDFQGQGVQFGQQVQVQASVNVNNAGSIIINNNEPTANIMIRLSNGQSITVTVNLSTKVQKLFDHVRKIVNAGNRQIQLIAGFPPKPLLNPQLTVEEADLMDSQINQTIV